MADVSIPQTLAHFRIDAKIGEGGMGVVYRAIDQKLGRAVALKVLPEDFAKNVDRRARFLREAQTAAGITHPNVVTIYEIGEADGRIFIAMELAAGKSLREWLGGPRPMADVLHIARGIGRALAKAHERGIVHRDLKPDNVIIGDQLEPKVLDFGLAKPFESGDVVSAKTALESQPTESPLTREGHIMGSPGYMSPEQAAGRAIDPRTDIFAFGVVLYEMVTGVRPFRGDSLVEVLVATTRDAPVAPRSIRPEVPVHIERAIARCLEKLPEARYASMGEVLRDLDAQTSVAPVDGLSPTMAADLSSAPTMAADSSPASVPTRPSVATPPRAGPQAVEPAAPARRRWALPVGVGALAFAALLGARLVAHERAAGGVAAVRGDASVPSTAPTAITDEPLPVSTNAEAVAEYGAGLQALRDDSFGQAKGHFLRAAALDDTMAMAHLHAAMAFTFSGDSGDRRAHFAKAVAFRGKLSERDQGFLQALEPTLGFLQEDREEAFARLEQLSARFPWDVEIIDWLGMLKSDATLGLTFADRAIALDPKDAQAWETRGRSLGGLGRRAEAREALTRCTATSMASSDCYVWLGQIDSAEGRCDDAERDVRRGLDRDPSFARFIPEAAVGAGKPVEVVRELMKQSEGRLPEAERHAASLLNEARLDVVAGDFTRAGEALTDYGAIIDADTSATAGAHLVVTDMAIGLAHETGDETAADRAARSFVVLGDTWPTADMSTHGLDDTVSLFRRSLSPTAGTAALTRQEFEKRRATWIDARRKASGANPGLIWAFAYAGPAQTPEDATEALDVLPQFAPLQWFPTRAGIPEAAIGRAFLLAGKPDEAIPYLTRAVGDCSTLAHPFAHTRAALDLGDALEKRHDTKGACAAYADIVARWGGAKPRSVTAEKAKARRRALACGD